MSQPQPTKRFTCRFCRHVLPAWLSVAQEPDGAMPLGHLGRQHPTEIGALLAQMRTTEDIAPMAAQAFEVTEDTGSCLVPSPLTRD